MNIKIEDVIVNAEPMRYSQWHNRKKQYVDSDNDFDVYFIEGRFYYAEADDPYQF